MDKALQFPGVSNAWTMPIKARIDMLSTGIRTPVGVKVIGTDLVEIDKLAKQIEQVLKAVPGTSSAYAERGIGGYYLDITPDRDGARALRHHDPGRAGHDRHRARRPDRDHDRGGPPALHGQHALSARPARQSASDRAATSWCRCRPAARCRSARSPVTPARGPTSIRTENGQLAAYIFVDIRDRDLGGYVADAQSAVQASIQFPPGYLRDLERPVRISRARRRRG